MSGAAVRSVLQSPRRLPLTCPGPDTRFAYSVGLFRVPSLVGTIPPPFMLCAVQPDEECRLNMSSAVQFPRSKIEGIGLLVRALILWSLLNLADGSEIARDRYRERSNSDTVFGIFSASPFSFSLSSSLAVYIEDFLSYKKISEQYCASRSTGKNLCQTASAFLLP